jgi:predicted phosphodiesterase
MVQRVAVLSDVHGVLPVLEAVLAEPAVAEADLVVVTGDHASGPQPGEVLDRLTALGERAVLVRGNADRELVALARGEVLETSDEVSPWAAAQLTVEHVALLTALPHPVTIEVDGFGPVLFCHGTPRDDPTAQARPGQARRRRTPRRPPRHAHPRQQHQSRSSERHHP